MRNNWFFKKLFLLYDTAGDYKHIVIFNHGHYFTTTLLS